ncbi:hypothetical protein QBC35DRAFT_241052 [Podospora australis]|uniref:DUF8035 domain-containing protein n=1 Tax=Podospora australis TaxID=1536484 RepID=A0AAN6WTE2_9PEZI|nr:hypothetical protein QBC35DRAFT_241052 [Podospora australis]
MTVTNGNTLSIESVDALVRQLYGRARTAGPDFAQLSKAVRGLQTVLKHLHAEVRDPDSLLNQPGPSSHEGQYGLFVKQLTVLVEGSDYVLKQVKAVLERYGGSSVGHVIGSGRYARQEGYTTEEDEDEGPATKARLIELTRKKLVSQKTEVNLFLDTVQLNNPSKSHRALQITNNPKADMIKDKVDAIALRLFREKGSPTGEVEEELWQEFKAELEKEGFDPKVLGDNKEVLRAFIRELESHEVLENGAPPSVRGLLEFGGQSPMVGGVVVSHPMPNGASKPNDDNNPKSNERRRRLPGSDAPDSLQIHRRSEPPAIFISPSNISNEASNSSSSSSSLPSSSESSDAESSASNSRTALISTWDLLAFDRREADRMTARMASMHLTPGLSPNYNISPGTSPNNRYLPPGTQQLMIPGTASHPHDTQLSKSHSGQQQGAAATPRYASPAALQLPPPYSRALSPTSSVMTPPPPYTSATGSSAGAAFDLHVSTSAPPTEKDMSRYQPPSRQHSSLAPDGSGKQIPLDATWTKINRDLVSPVVLERAGVRYEARPNFVAVLGRLNSDQIAEFARQTAEVRGIRTHPRQTQTEIREPPGYLRAESRRGGGGSRRERQTKDPYRDTEKHWEAGDSSDDNRDRRTKGAKPRREYTPRDYRPQNYQPQEHRDYYDNNEKSGRGYPTMIVPPPESVYGDGKVSPSSTVDPKPILKNRNRNHVRFDGDGQPREISPGYYSDKNRREGGGNGAREKRREERERDRDKKRGTTDRDKERTKDRTRDRDREREKEREKEQQLKLRSQRGSGGDRDRSSREHRSSRHHDRDSRERERDRDRGGERSQDRMSRLRRTAGAIGIGGATATLLSVLAEAVEYL